MKTSELTGAALHWAVAKAERRTIDYFRGIYKPSTDWAQGGPIIEQFSENDSTFCLFFNPYKDHPAYGNSRPWKAEYKGQSFYAETPLIAAMRCYCSAKLGDEINIPEELCQQQSS